MPKILITNDDGIFAPGIQALWEALRGHADVTIVAPSSQKSGVGAAITIRQPLRVEAIDKFEGTKAWSVGGTPADCVKMALGVLMDSPPDLVVSGINQGSNAARSVLCSGTVGGAIEATMHAIPGIAFSCYEFHTPNYEAAASFTVPIVDYILKHPLKEGVLLNVNFPCLHAPYKGIKWALQGRQYWVDKPIQDGDHFWIESKELKFEEHAESDIAYLEKGYVTATPIKVTELTCHDHYKARKTHFESFFRLPVTK